MDTHRPQPRIFAICDAAQCSPDSPLTPAEIARRAGDPHNRKRVTPKLDRLAAGLLPSTTSRTGRTLPRPQICEENHD